MIAQPVLSRQIRAFEAELGVQLFVRDTHGTELTDHGRLLYQEAEALLASAAAVRRRIAIAARGESEFTVGFMPGLMVTTAVRAFQRAHPDVSIAGHADQLGGPGPGAPRGRADVSYLRRPFDAAGWPPSSCSPNRAWSCCPTEHELATASGVADGRPRRRSTCSRIQPPCRSGRPSPPRCDAGGPDPSAEPDCRGEAGARRRGPAGSRSSRCRPRTFYRRADVAFVPVPTFRRPRSPRLGSGEAVAPDRRVRRSSSRREHPNEQRRSELNATAGTLTRAVAPIGEAVGATRAGTATIDLGPPTNGANTVILDVSCISATGNISVPPAAASHRTPPAEPRRSAAGRAGTAPSDRPPSISKTIPRPWQSIRRLDNELLRRQPDRADIRSSQCEVRVPLDLQWRAGHEWEARFRLREGVRRLHRQRVHQRLQVGRDHRDRHVRNRYRHLRQQHNKTIP